MSYAVMVGDVIEQLKTLDDDCIDLIATDPPYNLGMDTWDKWESNAAFSTWCAQWAAEAYRVLKPSGTIFSFGSSKTYHWMAVALEQSGFITRDMIEWVYWSSMPRGDNLKSCHEPIYVGSKKKHGPFNVDTCRIPFSNNVKGTTDTLVVPRMPSGKHPGRGAYGGDTKSKKYKTALDNKPYTMDDRGRHPFNIITLSSAEATFPTNVLDIKKPRGSESIVEHQTQKPVAIMKWLIELASQPGDLVLDCFGGSGTTGEAAIIGGRSCVLIESNQDYAKLIKVRLKSIHQQCK